MTSPGGVEVGRVSIRVVPDTSKFRQEAKRKLEKIAKSLQVQVAVTLDDKRIKAELEKLRRAAGEETAKMDVEVDGDGARREAGRVKQFIQKTLGAIKATIGLNLAASVARIRADIEIINKLVKGYNIRIPMEVVGISKWLAILASVAGVLLTIPHLLGAIGGAVMVVGGLLATLPALAAGAAAGIAALVVGLNGFFSALSQAGDAKKFEEALKNLAPSARDAARALATFRQPLHEIRLAVQDELFQGMDKPLLRLKALLPPIKTGLSGVAGGVRDMIKDWIRMATTAKSVKDTGTILGNIRKGFAQARPAAANFGQAMRDITVVGSTFLPALGKAVGNVSKRFADWAQTSRENGNLEKLIQNAVDKMKQLGRIIRDVVKGFQNIFETLRGGEDFLDIIERVAKGFREWSELDSTQSALQSLARVMRIVIDAAGELFGQVFRSAGEVFRELEPFLITFAQTFATVLADAIRAVTPLLKDVARWLSENKAVVVPLAITVVSLVTAFKLLATAARGVSAVKDSFQVLKAGAKVIGDVSTGIGGSVKSIGASLLTSANNVATWVSTMTAKWREAAAQAVVNAAKVSGAWIKSAAKSAAFTARYYTIMVAQAIAAWVKMAAAAVFNASKIAITWIAQTVRAVAATIAQMAIAVAVWVANWIRMAAVALAQAARIAIAWLIALGPIGLLIIAIVALVAVVVLNWDKIVAATKAAWSWIGEKISAIGNWIKEKIGAAVDWVRSKWDRGWKFVTDIIADARNFISAVVNKIKSVLRSIGNILGEVVSFFDRIRDGAVEKLKALINWIKELPGKLLNIFKAGIGKIVDIGKAIIDGIVRGLKNAVSAVYNWIKGMVSDVINSVKEWLGIASPSKVFTEIGEFISKGLALGIRKSADIAAKQSSELAAKVTKAFGNVDLGAGIVKSLDAEIPAAIERLDKLEATMADVSADFTTKIVAEDIRPMEDRILDALASGLVIELDGQKVTKSVNKNNNRDRRRN